MIAFRRLILLVVFFYTLSACIIPGLAILPIASVPLSTAPLPATAFLPLDSTTTATPFQPIPPTPVYIPTDFPTPTPTDTPPAPTPLPTDTPAPPPAGNLLHILLLGSDARPWDSISRTDTIILATLQLDRGNVSLTSFPRDLYLQIPGWGADRINTAYVHGGIKALIKTFEANFGITPEYYVLIKFSAFKQFVDSLGGLDVYVTQPLSDFRPGYGWVNIQEGPMQMDADMVLWYVRSRKTSNDFARSRRQQEVLQAIANKLVSMDAIKRAPELYALYQQSVTTNMSLTDMLMLLPFAAQLTDTSRIHHYFIGPQQTYDWITPSGGMVLLPRQDAIMKVLRKALNGE